MKNKNWLQKIAEGESNEKAATGFKAELIAALKTPLGNDSIEDILAESIDNAMREANIKDVDAEQGVEVKITVIVEVDGKKEVDVNISQTL